MQHRIKEFIQKISVTAAEFADRIGVQRSAVSHILNGRNNPSAVVLEKILNAYPQLNARWLITGEGNMEADLASSTGQTPLSEKIGTTPPVQPTPAPPVSAPEPSPVADSSPSKPAAFPFSPALLAGGDIEQIIIFYTDSSFRAFSPRQGNHPQQR